MKNWIFLAFASILFNCKSSTQISQLQFENDLFTLFDIVLVENENPDKNTLYYFFGSNLDSTNIYYELVDGYNNQYLLYLTRRPFLDIDLQSYLIDGDTILGTKHDIYSKAMNQPWFEMYRTCLAYYLQSKGITIQDYELAEPVIVKGDELIKIASRFFYIYTYDEEKGFGGKVCGGINPYMREGLVINPLVEAHAFESLVQLVVQDKSIHNYFSSVLIPELNERFSELNGSHDQLIQLAKEYTYDYYESDSDFREKMISQYHNKKSSLPFKIVE